MEFGKTEIFNVLQVLVASTSLLELLLIKEKEPRYRRDIVLLNFHVNLKLSYLTNEHLEETTSKIFIQMLTKPERAVFNDKVKNEPCRNEYAYFPSLVCLF